MTSPVPLTRFPDAARTLAALLIDAGLIAAGHAGSNTPADLLGSLPFIRVLRQGGDSDRVNDYATCTLEVFAATSTAGEQLAEQVRQYLTQTPPPPIGGVLLDRVDCQSGPSEQPWNDSRVRRFGATYRVVSRRTRG